MRVLEGKNAFRTVPVGVCQVACNCSARSGGLILERTDASASCVRSFSEMVLRCVASLLELSVHMDESSPGNEGRTRVLKRQMMSRERNSARPRSLRALQVFGLWPSKERNKCVILRRNMFYSIICFLAVRRVPAVLA